MDAKQYASDLYDALFVDKRDNGDEFVRLKDGSPEWMTEVVRKAHGDMMPDDTKYRMVMDVAGRLADYEVDNWLEFSGEIADSLVDIYNMQRVRWLATHLDRAWYVNDAVDELGVPRDDFSIFDVIGMGQYREYEETVQIVAQYLIDKADKESDA